MPDNDEYFCMNMSIIGSMVIISIFDESNIF
jgi:hypothetical protein